MQIEIKDKRFAGTVQFFFKTLSNCNIQGSNFIAFCVIFVAKYNSRCNINNKVTSLFMYLTTKIKPGMKGDTFRLTGTCPSSRDTM